MYSTVRIIFACLVFTCLSSVVLSIGVDLGLCSGNTLACQCGDPGYIVQIPVKHCTFFYKFKPYCRPCDLNTGISKEQMCEKYKNCQDCKPTLPSCAACPPNKYGLWCTGVCDCRNGGTCSTVDGKCVCRHGFKGSRCETRIGCLPPTVEFPLMESRVPADTPFYIEYSCANGYKMIGLSRITCLPNHQWSNNPPKCARVCHVPPAPINGKLSLNGTTSFIEGEQVEFSCDEGYALIGQDVLKCSDDGSLSHDLPICEKLVICSDPGQVQFGQREVHSMLNLKDYPFVAGTRVLYACPSEFLLLGPSSLICRTDGSWSSRPPACIKVSSVQIDCHTKGKDVLEGVGITVRLQCPAECSTVSGDSNVWGTVIYEESSAVCPSAIHAGRITNAGGSLYVVNNGDYSYYLASEMNGISSKGRQELGGSFRFHYNPDWLAYEIKATISQGCPLGWIALDEYCAYVVLQSLAWEEANGLCSNLSPDASVAVTLPSPQEEVRLDNITNALKRALREKGLKYAWGEIVVAYNESLQNSSSEEYDEVIDGKCALLSLEGDRNRRFCTDSFPFICLTSLAEDEGCNDPGLLANGFTLLHGRRQDRAQGYVVGSILTFSCAAVHYLRGNAQITCTSNLTWNGPKPECLRVKTCPEPVSILFGYVETLPPTQNDVFRRKAVIQIKGNSTKQNRKVPVGLSGTQRNYLEATSKVRPQPNVTIPEGFHIVGSRALYSCHSRYYQLIGSQTRRCQSDGQWSGRIATCIPVCGRSDSPRTPFITNGNASDLGQWPWQVAVSQWLLDYNLWFMVCGGTLLTERYVVTAAHCVTFQGSNILVPAIELRVHLGKYYRSSDRDDEYVQMRLVKELLIHPDYDPNQYDADIALIEMKESAILTSRVQPVCLPTTATTRRNIVSGKIGVVTGWGLTENATYGELLRQATIPVVSDETCQNSYENVKVLLTITENMYCAGHSNSTTDTCSGDSGGPMVFPDDSGTERRWVLEGVVSWGSPNGCGKPNQYGGYTIVSRFLDWLKEYI